MVEIERYEVGHLRTNCYIIKDKDTNKMAIIDPGYKSYNVESIINQNIDNIEYILLTHGHFDHVLKADEYRKLTGAKIVIGEYEDEFTRNSELNLSSTLTRKLGIDFSADILIKDGDSINLGNTKIKAVHTPGHTKGGVCYIIDNNIFSGDTLMKGTVGRTDFVTGSMSDMENSLKKIASINGDFNIYPGHGENTTLEYEKNTNVYLGKYNYDNLY